MFEGHFWWRNCQKYLRQHIWISWPFKWHCLRWRSFDHLQVFLEIFLQLSKVVINLFFGYDLQIVEQTKHINQVLEQYLHCTINYHQDNWKTYQWQSLLIITSILWLSKPFDSANLFFWNLCQIWYTSKVRPFLYSITKKHDNLYC